MVTPCVDALNKERTITLYAQLVTRYSIRLPNRPTLQPIGVHGAAKNRLEALEAHTMCMCAYVWPLETPTYALGRVHIHSNQMRSCTLRTPAEAPYG